MHVQSTIDDKFEFSSWWWWEKKEIVLQNVDLCISQSKTMVGSESIGKNKVFWWTYTKTTKYIIQLVQLKGKLISGIWVGSKGENKGRKINFND